MLKIIAIILIVIFHVIQSLTNTNSYITYDQYILDISHSTTSISNLLLVYFRQFGALGNNIFFVCSAWFLLESKKTNKYKIFTMIVKIWIISILFLLTFIFSNVNMSNSVIIKSLFPTTFSVNWYMTCYIIFYMIHPALNKMIYSMDRVQLFRTALLLDIMYIFADFIKKDLFFPSNLILWFTLYIIIAYIKQFKLCFQNNIKLNFELFGFCLLVNIILIAVTDFLGLHVNMLDNKLLYWENMSNPFIIGQAISLFNIFRNFPLKNHIINYMSSLSILVYIIHENLIFRNYIRPCIWQYIYNNIGYRYVLLEVFSFAIVLFIMSIIIAIIFNWIFNKLSYKIIKPIYNLICNKYRLVETKIM